MAQNREPISADPPIANFGAKPAVWYTDPRFSGRKADPDRQKREDTLEK